MTSLHRSQMGFGLVILMLLSCGIIGTYFSRATLNKIQSGFIHNEEHPPIYLPDSKYVELVTLGYRTTAAKVLWFATNNYFGKQFVTNQDYRWLSSMCKVTSTLDPKATHVFEFCATLLAWVANDPKEGISILSTAIDSNPNYWRYFYLRGFTYWYFLKDNDLAKRDYLSASKLPNSPPELSTIASRFISSNDGPDIAIRFLQELIPMTQDAKVRKKLGRKLKQAILARDLQYLQDAANNYEKKFGTFPNTLQQLIDLGYISTIPPEPFRGQYIVEPESKTIKTTSGKKPLLFVNKSPNLPTENLLVPNSINLTGAAQK